MDARVPGERGPESHADGAKVLSELRGREPTSALTLSQRLGCPKVAIQRCLYQLLTEGRVQKVEEKLWRLPQEEEVNGDTGEERGPIEPQADRAKVLSELRGQEPTSALTLSRRLGCPKVAVQRCLYQLLAESRVQKVGLKLWRLPQEVEVDGDTGEERGAAGAGPVVTRNEAREGRQDRSQSQTQVTSIVVLGDFYSTTQQVGTTSNYITTHVQGTSFVQVGSGNIVQRGGSSVPRREDPEENAQTGDPRGSAEQHETDVEIITEGLVGMQIGNDNSIINQAGDGSC
ncbi:uncharacterized protein [Mobula birostris]|uniref:uncharacterized protein isoform X2 n=1 Tax=Mobula birostris TaxID=1983395 RepID=UPI003B286A58